MAEEADKAKEAAKEPAKDAVKKEADKPAKEGEAPAEGEAAAVAPSGKKKLFLMVGAGAALFLIIAGGAVWWFVLRTPAQAGPDAKDVTALSGGVVYYDIPEISVNLAPAGQQDHYLRLKVALEMASEAEQKAAEANLPRVQDDFLQYLRQLRLDDLRGNAGLERLKEDLLLRANQDLAPVRVRNVLFREVLVQ